DVGAAWMHETSQNKLVKLISKLGIDYYYDDGAALFYTEQGRAGAQFKAKKVADEFADYAEWFYKTNPDAPDRDVASFIAEFVRDHELISKDERDWAPQAIKEIELWIGTSVEQASSKHLSYFVTERNLYMKGGYDSIVQWNAKSVIDQPGVLHLEHVVETINWSKTGETSGVIECRKSDGTLCAFDADAIVCTLPLGTLRHSLVTFTPSLPETIQTGISSFSYGALGKVFFEFAEVFWSKDNDQFMYYPTPPAVYEDDMYGSSVDSSGSSDHDSILNYATVTINLWIMKGSKELCVQIAEPLTQRIEAMTDQKALFKFFEPLFKLLRTEPYKALPPLRSVETTHWTQDPFAGFGSYSADKVNDDPNLLIDALEANKSSRLQFAGEHCTLVGNGCVHGAFYTGEVAASNILQTLGI
ncbi:hypothetical protein K461DRAFT_209040, partial [Myriangium duriaei CBS 260.36]